MNAKNTYYTIQEPGERSKEQIELDQKISDIWAKAEMEISELKEKFREELEQRRLKEKAKKFHDKLQALVDSGFSEAQAFDILQKSDLKF